jgi:hypothetical protein
MLLSTYTVLMNVSSRVKTSSLLSAGIRISKLRLFDTSRYLRVRLVGNGIPTSDSTLFRQ